MLKLIGSVMIFGSCAALGLNARRELRRRVAAADAMLLALRLMENEITAHRTPMPEIIDLLAKNENAVVRQIFSGVRRRMRERSGLSLSYLWCAGMRAAQADAGLGREECGVLCDAANFLGRYDASEQKAAIDTALKSSADGVAALQTALASCGNCQIGISTYTGTGTRGEEYPTVITFPKMPTVFFVRGRGTFFAAQGGASEGSLIVYDSGSAQIQDALLSWSGNQLSIVSSNNAKYQLNTDNSLYWVLALYQMDA